MLYLTTHSTHFIYDYITSDMVKDNSDSKRENLLPSLHRLPIPGNSTIPHTQPLLHQLWSTGWIEKRGTALDHSDDKQEMVPLRVSSKDSFICTIPQIA